MDVIKKSKKRKFWYVDESIDLIKDPTDNHLVDILFDASVDSHFTICKVMVELICSQEIQRRVILKVLKKHIACPQHENIVPVNWVAQWIQILAELDNKFLDSFTKLVDEYLTEIRHVKFDELFTDDETRIHWCKNTTLTDSSFVELIKRELTIYEPSELILTILEKNEFEIKIDTYYEILNNLKEDKSDRAIITLLEVAKRKHIPLCNIERYFILIDISFKDIKIFNHFFLFTYQHMKDILAVHEKSIICLQDIETILSFSTNLTITEYKNILYYMQHLEHEDEEGKIKELFVKSLDELMFSQPFIQIIAYEIRDINTFPDCLISLIAIYTHGTHIENLKEKENRRLLFELSFSNHKNYKKP